MDDELTSVGKRFHADDEADSLQALIASHQKKMIYIHMQEYKRTSDENKDLLAIAARQLALQQTTCAKILSYWALVWLI